VAVKRVLTDCESITSTLHDLIIQPGEIGRIAVTSDSSKAPNFGGQLVIPVEGRSDSDKVIFQTAVRIKIIEPRPPSVPSQSN